MLQTLSKIILIILAVMLGLAAAFFAKAGLEVVVEKVIWIAQNKTTQEIITEPAGPALKQVTLHSRRPDRVRQGTIDNTIKVPLQGKAIVADLDDMNILLFENGELQETHSILSKGRPGSPWETPAGNYTVNYKIENHFSSIGEVWMPYSMQFFGNFFIHGWPSYPNGTPVEEGYSGGCIRLADEVSKIVYEFADVGTQVAVVGGSYWLSDASQSDGYYEFADDAQTYPPVITAKSYVVADLETGEVLLQKDAHSERTIASISKFMTALVSLETVNQFQQATVSRSAVDTYGYRGGLKVGETWEVGDMLYPLLLESSNDAAEVIAEHIGRNSFMANMNQKAQSIGLKKTMFDDPSGLSSGNISTAADLFRLTQYIYKHKRYILDLTKLKHYSSKHKTWYNISKFEDDENYIGGKVGYTDHSGHTLVTTFDVELSDSVTRPIGIILLQAHQTERDTRKILSYISKTFSYVTKVENEKME